MLDAWQDVTLADESTIATSSHGGDVVLSCVVMSILKVRFDEHTIVLAVDQNDFSRDSFAEAVSDINGEYDWWYGEVAPGVDAYVITTEDANGNVGVADWKELPELFRNVVLAGMRPALLP